MIVCFHDTNDPFEISSLSRISGWEDKKPYFWPWPLIFLRENFDVLTSLWVEGHSEINYFCLCRFLFFDGECRGQKLICEKTQFFALSLSNIGSINPVNKNMKTRQFFSCQLAVAIFLFIFCFEIAVTIIMGKKIILFLDGNKIIFGSFILFSLTLNFLL